MSSRFRVSLLCAFAVVLLAPVGCAQLRETLSPTAAVSSGPDPDTAESARSAQIRALERAIEADRARLIGLISQQPGEGESLSEGIQGRWKSRGHLGLFYCA